MKLKSIAVLGALILAANAWAEDAPALKTQKEKVSYSIGIGIARDFKQQGVEVDQDIFIRGLVDGLNAKKPIMSEEDLKATASAYQAELKQKQTEARKATAENNKKMGDAYLAKNKTQKGVITTESGLQYKIIKKGDGAKPTDDSMVECHYKGTLIDGTEFDSSYRRGQPATFPVKGVIPGWKEALKLMPVGSKWELVVPSELAYGERGAGREIGPNATLVFEVELLSIK